MDGSYLSTEAVSNTSNALDAEVPADVFNGSLDNRVDDRGLVFREPLREVGPAGLHVAELDRVSAEEVGENG